MKDSLTLALRLALPVLLVAAGCANSETSDNDPSGRQNPGATAQEGGDSLLQQGMQDKNVRDQKRAILVDQYVQRGRMALADGRMAEAQDAAVRALELDFSSGDARRLMDDVNVAMGNPAAALDSQQDDVANRQRARMQRLQADVDAQVASGEERMNAGDYAGAIGDLTQAKANIAGASFSLDWGTTPQRIEDLLAQARAGRETAMQMDREREVEETYSRLQEQARAEEARSQARIDMKFQDALDAFDSDDFELSARLCEEILRDEDPLHARAREVRDASWRARGRAVTTEFKESRRDLFRRWNQDLEEARILQSELLVNPDPKTWRELSELRKRFRTTIEDNEDSAINLQLATEIAEQKIPSLSVQGETSLDAVIDQLRLFTRIPFVVTPDATDAVGPDVVYTFRHGVVYITTRANANSDLVLKPHDVKDLVAQLIDHSGPRIDRIKLPDDDLDEEDGTLFGGIIGDPVPIYDPDNLETLIRQSIAPGTWDEIEGVSISFKNGLLFVRHTAKVQNEIHEFLQNLRLYTSSMVHIEARFLTITKDYLQEIGVDWRGNGGQGSALSLADLDDVNNGLTNNASAGLDNNGLGLPAGAAANPSSGAYFDEFGDGDLRMRNENILGAYGTRQSVNGGLTMQLSFLDDMQYNLIMRAVEKEQSAQELQSTFLSAQNTQRAYATMINQISYIQEFNVEVALAAFIADPEVGVVSDGIVLDVRPTISQSRKYIMLELRPTVATLIRPLPEFTSSLAGLTTPITIQLPELQVASANTTAVVPDGGTVVIGGLKKLFNIEQTSEVPFLASIPVLNLLFKTEGEASENRDVILLIRAKIIDANEIMDSLDAVASRRR